jgi:hypothetical protein
MERATPTNESGALAGVLPDARDYSATRRSGKAGRAQGFVIEAGGGEG